MTHAVIFLARGGETGLEQAHGFFDSYGRHSAGVPHDLIVLSKGWLRPADRDVLAQWSCDAGGRVLELPDDGFDWGAYFRAVRSVDQEWVTFLNTHSRIQGDRWLEMLASAAAEPGCGCAGATGSWGSMVPRLAPPWPAFHAPLVHAVYAARNIRRFPAFPNPHIRSTGFLISRAVFIDFADQQKIPCSKRDAHALESGRHGLTAFMRQRGYRPAVVGRDGKRYAAEEWPQSGTFRVPGQENLLISDNQTRYYADAPDRIKRMLERDSWGRSFTR